MNVYNMNADGSITYQAVYGMSSSDPAGIGCHESTTTLFLTSEFSSGVEIFDGQTNTYIGMGTGPSNLAGIDVDEANNIVYSLRRASDDLYAWDFNPATKTLTPKSGFPINLPGCTGGYGIAYDDSTGILWVADGYGGTTRAYDTSTWSQTGDSYVSIIPSHDPIDVDVDKIRGIVYTVSGYSGFGGPGGTYYISKYVLATTVESSYYLGQQGVGLSVDDATGYLYVTCSPYQGPPGSIKVLDPSTWTLIDVETSNMISPAGIYAGGGFLPDVSVDKAGPSIASQGETVTYTLTYTCAQGPATNVVLTDTLSPGLTYVSASTTPDSIVGQVLTWNLGTLNTGDNGAISIDATVTAPPGSVLNNFATIDSDVTPPQTDVQTTIVRIDQVIPEVPYGNFMTMSLLLLGFIIHRKFQ
jgi:uncharacterized repeat protein (TIGR01451 family)